MTEDRIGTWVKLPEVAMAEARTEAAGVVALLPDFHITDAKTADDAGSLRRDMHDKHKALDALRLETGKPAREAQGVINEFFRQALGDYSKAKALLGQKLSAYQVEQERSRREAMVAVAQGNAEALALTVPPPPVEGVAMRNTVDIRVVDIDLMPREFLCADMSKLKILERSGGDPPPGVEFHRGQKAVVGR